MSPPAVVRLHGSSTPLTQGPRAQPTWGIRSLRYQQHPELRRRQLPMHKVCVGKYLLSITGNTPEPGDLWPQVPDFHSSLRTRAPLRLLYDRLQDTSLGKSSCLSLAIPPLCQSSFYLNAFTCRKCLVTFAPFSQIPLTIVCLIFIPCRLIFLK